jgi:hypothetical protein
MNKARPFKAFVAIALCFGIVVIVWLDLSTSGVDGKYDFPPVRPGKFSYLRFNGGQVELVAPGWRTNWGRYSRESNRWIYIAPGGFKCPISYTRTELFIFNPDGSPDLRLKRILIPPEAKLWAEELIRPVRP